MPTKELEIGRATLPNGRFVVVRLTTFRNIEYLDIRKYVDSPTFKGWTTKGIAIPFEDPKVLDAVAFLIIKARQTKNPDKDALGNSIYDLFSLNTELFKEKGV